MAGFGQKIKFLRRALLNAKRLNVFSNRFMVTPIQIGNFRGRQLLLQIQVLQIQFTEFSRQAFAPKNRS